MKEVKATTETTLDTMGSVTDRAMLVAFTASIFGNQTNAFKAAKEIAAKYKIKDPKMVSSQIKLFDPAIMQELRTVLTAARETHYKHTWLWTDDRWRVLSNSLYSTYSHEMREHEINWNKALSVFLANYTATVNQVEKDMKGLFEPTNYPPADKIGSHFYFRFEVTPIGNTLDKSDPRIKDLIDPEVERIKRRLEKQSQKNNSTTMKEYIQRLCVVVGGFETSLSTFRDESNPKQIKVKKNSVANTMADFV